jgi:hypothetical protein
MRYKSPIKIREIKKDLNLSINLRNRLFKNRLNFTSVIVVAELQGGEAGGGSLAYTGFSLDEPPGIT